MRPSLLTWVCTSLSAGLPRWSFLALLPLLCFKRVWHRFLGCLSLLCGAFSRSPSLSLKLVCCRLEIFNILPGDCAAVSSRSASLHPATELRSSRGQASVCTGPCCESSSGAICAYFLHLWSHCSFLRDLDLSLKLFDITSTRSFQSVPISPGTSLL